MRNMKLTTKIFIGLVFGVIVGLFMQGAPQVAQIYIKPFWTLFINLIKMVIVPLVFSSLIIGISSIGDPKLLGRIGGKTLAYYLATTAIAVFIGLFLGLLFQPGAGLSIPLDAAIKEREVPPITTTLLNIIPKNPLQGLVSGNILQVIAFALFLGGACTVLPKKKGEALFRVF